MRVSRSFFQRIQLIAPAASGKPVPDERLDYFPELFLSKWFRQHEKAEVTVYTFDKLGTGDLRSAPLA